MKMMLFTGAFLLIFVTGCSLLNSGRSNQYVAKESTVVLNRDESSIFELIKTRVKVCDYSDYIELGRGESRRIDVPVGKCIISTDQGWHSGSYFIEINAEKGKVHIIRISPRGDYLGATEAGFIGTVEERQAHIGKSGPFELIEIKQ